VLRSSLAALDPSGKVLASWDPALGVGGDVNPEVYALATSGNTVYVGGYFSTAKTSPRTFAVAVDGTSALPTEWDPSTDGAVRALAIRGDTVFVGGDFIGRGGVQRNHLAALNPDGTLSEWNPNAAGPVNALVMDGNTIYIGGEFQSVGGLGRANLAAIDASGNVLTWNPGATSATNTVSWISSLALGSDAIFVGGTFGKVGTAARTNVASIDRAGQVTDWSPTELTDNVGELLISGSDVYCTSLGLYHYTWPAAVADWSLPVTGGAVAALALVSQNGTDDSGKAKVVTTLLAGGTFATIGASGPANLAAIDVDTHDLTTAVSLPTLDDGILSMAVADGTVYIGGYFNKVASPGTTDAQERAGLAAFELATGALTPWQPDVYQTFEYPFLGDVVPAPGGIDVLGGFYSVDGKIGSGIARVSR
jgi:hypothetical protein